MSLTSARREVD